MPTWVGGLLIVVVWSVWVVHQISSNKLPLPIDNSVLNSYGSAEKQTWDCVLINRRRLQQFLVMLFASGSYYISLELMTTIV
jgi:hypothetical protein